MKSREMVFELLASNMRPREQGPDNQAPFWKWAASMGIAGSDRYASKFDGGMSMATKRPLDLSNPAIAVNLDACIACGACVRACREVQVNDVIGMGLRGSHAVPVFDIHDPMGLSTCVTCGECVQACPTGALYEKSLMDKTAHEARRAEVRQGRQYAVPVLRRRLPDVGRREGQPHRAGRRPQRLRERESALRQRPLRLRLRRVAGASDEAARPPRRRAEGRGRRRPCATRIASPCSAKPPGKRRWLAPPRASRRFSTSAAAKRCRASARRRARTRRRTCSRSSCARASRPTTSITARGSATRRRSPRSWKASARAPCRRRSTPRWTPNASSSSARGRP